MHSRKPNRLKGIDYSQPGVYFVTITLHNRADNKNIFGEIENGKMILNGIGKIVEYCWNDLPNHYYNIILDEHIIMPDHFHGIIFIKEASRTERFQTVPQTPQTVPQKHETQEERLQTVPYAKSNQMHGLPEIIRGFKTFSSKRINILLNQHNPVPPKTFQWHKSYYDHIIRDENEFLRIRKYIIDNPLNWNP